MTRTLEVAGTEAGSTVAAGTIATVNAVSWFEIPTTDLERATTFYEMLLGTSLRRWNVDERMSIFPGDEKGVRGALVQRVSRPPSDCGALIYLNCDNGLDAALNRLKVSGQGAVVLGKQAVPGGFGWIACVRDTEGNHVALHEH